MALNDILNYALLFVSSIAAARLLIWFFSVPQQYASVLLIPLSSFVFAALRCL